MSVKPTTATLSLFVQPSCTCNCITTRQSSGNHHLQHHLSLEQLKSTAGANPDKAWRLVVLNRWRNICPSCFDTEAEKAGVRYKFTDVEAMRGRTGQRRGTVTGRRASTERYLASLI